jgi:hypothetical protein
MATAQTPHYPDCSTLANFKAWAQFISNFFTSAGWVAGSDSGQVNWSTIVSVPTSAGTFQIWNSADSVSPATTICVRIDYWSASNVPTIKIQVGTNNTDGAGNLSTPYSSAITQAAYAADSSTLYPCYASGDTGSMRIVMFDNGSASYPGQYQPFGFFISRDYSTAGAAQGNYVQVLWLGGASASPLFQSQTVFNPSTGGATPLDISTQACLACLPFSYSTSASLGSSVCVSPIFPYVGYLGNPNPNVFVGRISDFPDAANVQMSVFGTNHNYLVWNQHLTWCVSQQTALIWRFE